MIEMEQKTITNEDIKKNIPSWKFSETAKEKPVFNVSIEEFLKKIYKNKFSFGYDNLEKEGIYRLLGWAFDFRMYLKKYVYKTEYYILEGYFLNKTDCRRNAYGKVYYIIEIKD
jgi:hypothetical protein|tara:strand:- start:1616 stop:1957 length:342 start_codon:yes stop_codon:yes gene_type:complete